MKLKNTLFWILLLLAGNLAATSVEVRETGYFSKIDVSGGIELYLTQGNNQRIEIVADDDLIKNVITKTDGNTLTVKLRTNRVSIWKNKTLKVYITAPEIEEIKISGGADLKCSELKCKSDFRLNVSGGADAEFNQLIVAKNAQINTSSGGDSEIKELKATSANLSSNSGSDIKANVMVSGHLELNASSGADISVRGEVGKVSASANSGADINLNKLTYGSIDSNTNSGGNIRK